MLCFCFFKQKTAYEMRISDWSSDVCSSDLEIVDQPEQMAPGGRDVRRIPRVGLVHRPIGFGADAVGIGDDAPERRPQRGTEPRREDVHARRQIGRASCRERVGQYGYISVVAVSLEKKYNTNRET